MEPFQSSSILLRLLCRISDLRESNKCTLQLLSQPFSWKSWRKTQANQTLTFSLAPSHTTHKDEKESNCSSPHCCWSVQLRWADGGAVGTRTGMLLLSSVCLSWPASWWKGADTKAETAAPPGQPASALQINPLGPGMSIMPCSFLLCASDFSLAAGRRRCLFMVHLGTGVAWPDNHDGKIKVQIKGKFQNKRWRLKLEEKFQIPLQPPGLVVVLKIIIIIIINLENSSLRERWDFIF